MASDADTIANGVAAIMPTVQTITGISDAVVAKVGSVIVAVKSAATTLATAVGQDAVAAATTISNGIADIKANLSSFTLPSWVSTVLSAAETLAPIVMQAAGVILPLAPAPEAVKQARAVLLAAAA